MHEPQGVLFAINNPVTPKPTLTKGVSFNPCSCVSAVRAFSGIDVGPIGYARNHPINTDWPITGGIVILDEGYFGHTAFVTKVDDEFIYIKESNFIPCTVGERKLRRDYSKILGYYWEY